MKPLAIEKTLVEDWLGDLCDDFDVFSPSMTKKGFYDWAPFQSGTGLQVPTGVPKSSIKTFFFPQPEVLFHFKASVSDPDAYRLKEPDCQERKALLFGVRPCDARSVVLNSMPYEPDPYFQARRKNTLIVGLLCKESCSTCFCKWTGGSPTGREGMDLALMELEDSYLVEPVSERGQALISSTIFRKPKEQEISLVQELYARKNGEDAASTLRRKGLMALYKAPFWNQVSQSCINCGTCTFLCPTCYCFDIQDETLRGKGRRIRYWDSCMFPLFTQHASGHNPRGDKIKRVRNRFMHKFKYFPDRFGPVSCVGCGRCVRDCPVNIDIRQVLSNMLGV